MQDSGVQIGNRNSKSEVLIQSEAALNAGETDNYSMDQLEATHRREHKDARYFWIPEQVQDKDCSIKKEKNCANMGKRCFSTAMLFKLQDWCSTRPWIPHSTTR